MRAELSEILWADTSCQCGWNKSLRERYTSLQSTYTPMKWLEVPILEIADKMKAVPEEVERKYCNSKLSSSYCSYHKIPGGRNTFRRKLDAMMKRASLCLDCVHDREARSCRFNHE